LFAGVGAWYLRTGHIVYGLPNNSNLFAVPFDLDRLEVTGGAVPIVEGVIEAAVSDAGTLAYVPGATSGAGETGRSLVWVNREGKEEPLGAPLNQYRHPNISPDGTRVAVTIGGENPDVWIWDSIRKTLTRLTFDKGNDLQSIWTPDGKRILYASTREGPLQSLYWKAADGTGAIEKVGSLPDRALLPWCWADGGKTIIMLETDFGTKWDIGMMSMEGDRARKPLLNEDPMELNPKISPDGKYMAYGSTESGEMEVYVRLFPEVNKGKWQVSTSGGNSPLWSPDGRELFNFTEDNTVMAVAVETKPAFNLGTPGKLFAGSFVNGVGEGTPWDIHPDGKRFLMMKPPGVAPTAGAASRPKITVVVNWLEELKKRVPVK
jgi:serine/threonine-protein kinase